MVTPSSRTSKGVLRTKLPKDKFYEILDAKEEDYKVHATKVGAEVPPAEGPDAEVPSTEVPAAEVPLAEVPTTKVLVRNKSAR